MSNYEQSAASFRAIVRAFGPEPDPSYNEADTRAKIIDQILQDALCWPEEKDLLRREEYVNPGYLDYRLRAGLHGLIIEAKRVGKSFSLPAGMRYGDKLSVKSLLHMQADFWLGLQLDWDLWHAMRNEKATEIVQLEPLPDIA